MERNPEAIWRVVWVQHDVSPFLSIVYTLVASPLFRTPFTHYDSHVATH